MRALGGLLAFGTLLAGCKPATEGRVVVLGMDGLEWSLLDRMTAAGELPNFLGVMKEGARADMEVTSPVMSPIIWTTLASGYPAEIHGIGGWTDGRSHSSNGADVRVRRVWDVASDTGKAVAVVGWLMTWPATPVHGSLLSDRFVWSFPMNKRPDAITTDPELTATTFPDALSSRATALRPDEAWLLASPLGYQVKDYGAPYHPLSRDETHLRVFEALWSKEGGPEEKASFGALYLHGADQVSHLYWAFSETSVVDRIRRDPAAQLAQVTAVAAGNPQRRPPPYLTGMTTEDLESAGRYVPDYYRYLDGALGRVLAVLTPDTTLLILSDHGFQLDDRYPLVIGSHRPTAVFLAWGARVKAGRPGTPVHVFDVAPTIYALLGLPGAEDFPGKILTDYLEVEKGEAVPTYRLERAAAPAAEGGLADEQLRQQLEALGYLDQPVDVGASRGVQKGDLAPAGARP